MSCLRALSGRDVPVAVTTRIYRFLLDQRATRIEEFSRHTLIRTTGGWWRSGEVFWDDESAAFGDMRGYLGRE